MRDVIIIGAGPAGMTAGIYTARKKLKTLILTRDVGGQTAWSSDVENYPGFTMLRGADLVEKFEDHLEQFSDQVELRLTTAGVIKIEKTSTGFAVHLGDGTTEEALALIVAGGKVPKSLGVPGEKEYINKGVTYCAWCDGPIFAGKDVAVIGGGNSALDTALSLTTIAKTIYIIADTPQLSADQILIDKAQASPAIRILTNCQTKQIKGDTVVRAVTVLDGASGLDKDIPVEGVFIEVGSLPATEYLKDVVALDEAGEVIIDQNNMTNVQGIFAAGDITNILYKQIVIAAGEGAKAALGVGQYLSKLPAKTAILDK